MRKRASRRIGLHPLIAAGLHRAERERKAAVIAAPMRALFALLATGEVHELDGLPVMRMPECDDGVTERSTWCAIAPAIRGWCDCWARIAADIGLYHMGVLADRLDRGQAVTPRLVEQAREEFEATIGRIPVLSDGAILSAITTTQVAWEIERGNAKVSGAGTASAGVPGYATQGSRHESSEDY